MSYQAARTTGGSQLDVPSGGAYVFKGTDVKRRVIEILRNNFDHYQFNVTNAYSFKRVNRTSPNADLHVIEGIIPLPLKAELQTAYTRISGLNKACSPHNHKVSLGDYEGKATTTKFHPATFILEERVSIKEQITTDTTINYFMDGSKMVDKTGTSYFKWADNTIKD
ncbi:hypothetical protein AVEN_11126-1 [Araneus ventricosus]|uniref:Uncharacterized protein n=1 Tax=Araneus ventricosus TaxID=182803 RepID=A0A4Y2JIV0_ARAVE|nr:hypothetical protein AVEN_11126-1 [Araneus ventricosus]